MVLCDVSATSRGAQQCCDFYDREYGELGGGFREIPRSLPLRRTADSVRPRRAAIAATGVPPRANLASVKTSASLHARADLFFMFGTYGAQPIMLYTASIRRIVPSVNYAQFARGAISSELDYTVRRFLKVSTDRNAEKLEVNMFLNSLVAGKRTRTCEPLLPKQVHYLTALHPTPSRRNLGCWLRMRCGAEQRCDWTRRSRTPRSP